MPISAARTVSTNRLTGSTPELRAGASGASVTELQQLLQRAGVPTGPVDGDFGPMTTAAVKRFQSSKGLPADGVVGPRTWSALKNTAPSTGGTTATNPTLRTGDFGADVEKLQRELVRHGFDVGGVDGSFGPGTRSALVRFQRAKGLEADGVAGPATWRALGGSVVAPTPPANGDFRSRILDAARAELGTTESGTNRGEALKYPQFFGRGAEAWCADFASFVMQKSGGKMNDPYCPSVVGDLKESGKWKGKTNPQPGDLVLFDWDGDREADHIGIVEKVNADGSIGTIEGNTENPQTGQEGVWRRTRSMGTILGFGAPY